MFATIYVLLYGNYHKLHRRLLDSLIARAPKDETEIVLWCNTVCELTKDLIRTYSRMPGAVKLHYFFSDQNVPKYKVMRNLFHRDHPPQTPWIIWFDDDTHVVANDWWSKTKEFIESKKDENICYAGFKWYVHHLPGQWDFIKAAKWFRDKDPEMCPTRRRGLKKPGITFANGAYVWLRTDVMKQLDWPDERLVHNGGDTLLGEAVRQHGLPFHVLRYGVRGNDAKRRGRNDKPAGSTVNTRR